MQGSREFARIIGLAMLGIAAVAAAALAIMWVSIAMHPDPGDLVSTFGVITVAWLVWALIGALLFRWSREANGSTATPAG